MEKSFPLTSLDGLEYSDTSADATAVHGRLRRVTPLESEDNDDFQENVFMKQNVRSSKRARTPDESEPPKDNMKAPKVHIKDNEKAAHEGSLIRIRAHAYDACGTLNARNASLPKTSLEAALEKRGRGHPPGKKKKGSAGK